jgi:type VI secretion system protein VasD
MTRVAPAIARFSLSLLLSSMVVFGMLGGCSTPPPKPLPPTIVQIALSADPGVNPDSRGRASPIVVRVFELKTLAAFNDADFFSLWDREKETLGEDLVAREEIQLRPGEQKKLERTLAPQARHIGVLAAYRDLERAKWRGTLTPAPNKTQAAAVALDARNVSIAAVK